MLTRLLTILTLAAAAVLAADGATPRDRGTVMTRGWKTVPVVTQSSPAPMVLTVDSVMYRKDVCRLYGRLSGRPNTSGCIDSLTVVDRDKRYPALDTDGFDLTHRFVWEDEGEFAIEVDFGPGRPSRELVIEVVAPGGKYSWKAERAGRPEGDRRGEGRPRRGDRPGHGNSGDRPEWGDSGDRPDHNGNDW